MANLVIDIGNSYTKVAVFEGNELLKAEHYKTIDIQILKQLVADNNIGKAIIASVKKEKEGWESELQATIPVVNFTRQMAKYKKPLRHAPYFRY
jgi:type III pantothenate kinase